MQQDKELVLSAKRAIFAESAVLFATVCRHGNVTSVSEFHRTGAEVINSGKRLLNTN